MKKRFNLLKLILFNWGSFPRGAKAPKRVRPIDDEMTVENISSELNKAKMNIKKLYELPKGAYIEHPKFGVLNTEESITFLNIHTEHHLRIAREIIKKSTIK